jgi:hypothetical protein
MKDAVIAQSGGFLCTNTHDASIFMATQRLDEPKPVFSIIRDDVYVGIAGVHCRTMPIIDELGNWREIPSSQTEKQGKHLQRAVDIKADSDARLNKCPYLTPKVVPKNKCLDSDSAKNDFWHDTGPAGGLCPACPGPRASQPLSRPRPAVDGRAPGCLGSDRHWQPLEETIRVQRWRAGAN